MVRFPYVQNNPINFIDPLGLSARSVILGTVSAGLNTAALALSFNPPAAAVVKWMGTAASGLTVASAYYEFRTKQMSGAEFAFTAGTEAANVLGGFAIKPVEALVTGLTRGIGVASTSVDAAKTYGGSCRQ